MALSINLSICQSHLLIVPCTIQFLFYGPATHEIGADFPLHVYKAKWSQHDGRGVVLNRDVLAQWKSSNGFDAGKCVTSARMLMCPDLCWYCQTPFK